ncbi:imidazolonepropionase [Glycomyces sp. L485]|uniref:imidazolonepropionase n=1 Tax=Glycomyces sp. L485 TaxID=2909235 RepID=UPI001F4B34FB|nr:imidazolonepropionase [Glycomyces sp. L485]MCH7231637.1 imidazolonepropionase [Glycomyces sp. L485]
MSLLIDNIGELFTATEEHGIRNDAALVVDGGAVAWIGARADAPVADQRLDAAGGAVIPGFVDSHSHIVFGGDRAAEFAARMSGESYTGGGIRTTVAATRRAGDDELRATCARLATEMLRQGTTTVEIKSGYGLTVADEERQLRIARELTTETTFLGAHTVPAAADADAYVELVCGEMLTACAPHARWVDVFCERGAFDGDQAREVLTAGIKAGLAPRVHANQLTEGPGVQLAVELGAASADHCTHLSDSDVQALAGGETVATLLPGAEFSTKSPYPDARRLIRAGATVALATDCNPGSSFTSSMAFCIALAVREMGMTPAEAVTAATLGGSKALHRGDIGRIALGARADVVVLAAPSHVHLAYRPGTPLVKAVVLGGTIAHLEP